MDKSAKPLYRSKTFGIATVNVAILHFFPGAAEWVSKHPEAYAEILTFTMIALRFSTKKALTWKRKKSS